VAFSIIGVFFSSIDFRGAGRRADSRRASVVLI
jgi:hypothetical protein